MDFLKPCQRKEFLPLWRVSKRQIHQPSEFSWAPMCPSSLKEVCDRKGFGDRRGLEHGRFKLRWCMGGAGLADLWGVLGLRWLWRRRTNSKVWVRPWGYPEASPVWQLLFQEGAHTPQLSQPSLCAIATHPLPVCYSPSCGSSSSSEMQRPRSSDHWRANTNTARLIWDRNIALQGANFKQKLL